MNRGARPRAMDKIAALVQRVEACELPLEEWTHRVHLTVSTWYLTNHGLEEGTRLMRDTIQRFNAHNGIEVTRESGYHETLTLAWLRKIDGILKKCEANTPLAERVERVLQVCSDKKALRQYYSRERMMSWEARLGWVEPDLRPID